MKRKVIDSGLERRFLIGLVTSKQFLASVSPAMDTSLFPAKYVQQIADWCLHHFKTYADAPGRDIETLYHSWVEADHPPENESDAVGDFLAMLSEQYDDAPHPNTPLLIKELSDYLTARSIARMSDAIATGLARGEIEDCLKTIQTFRTVSIGDKIGYVMNKQAVTRAFAEPPESIITFGGDAGRFFGTQFARDSLVGIQAPEKRGKTFWCLEFMYRALRSRRRVAIFQVGDLSEAQLTRRIAVRMTQRPLWRSQCGVIDYPNKIEIVTVDKKKEAKVDYDPKNIPDPIDLKSAKQGMKSYFRKLRLTGDEMRFSVHSNSSINIRGIDAILKRWQYEQEWVPDVIIIDYADILAPEERRGDNVREEVNDTWKALRKLSQDWHACVITPTQANAASYKTKTQTMGNFSNDKRKNAHVTSILGINQTAEEKRQGVQRLNWIVVRESSYDSERCLWVAQCLPLGVAHAKSVLG